MTWARGTGARVVGIAADLPGWQPTAVDREHLIFLYHMPAEPEGLASYLDQGKMD
jgi:hypothetical protein